MLKDSLNTYFISVCFGDKYIGENRKIVKAIYRELYQRIPSRSRAYVYRR